MNMSGQLLIEIRNVQDRLNSQASKFSTFFYHRAQQSEALEGGSTDFWPPAADPSSSKEIGFKNILRNSLLT